MDRLLLKNLFKENKTLAVCFTDFAEKNFGTGPSYGVVDLAAGGAAATEDGSTSERDEGVTSAFSGWFSEVS